METCLLNVGDELVNITSDRQQLKKLYGSEERGGTCGNRL